MNIFSLMKKAIRCLFSQSTMSSPIEVIPFPDPFADITGDDLTTNTGAFLGLCRAGILRSPSPIKALERFTVESITDNKSTDHFSEHELLTVIVIDTWLEHRYLFLIERCSSSNPYFKASKKRVDLLSSYFPSFYGKKNTSSADVELAPLTGISQSSEDLLLPPPPPTKSRRITIAELLSISSLSIVGSSSSSSNTQAVDKVIGYGSISRDEIGRVVGALRPCKLLSLFDLAILVETVHQQAIEYSLLKSQCFWFSRTIFEIVELVYGNSLNNQGKGKAPMNYLPPAGHWGSLAVHIPEETGLREIGNKFLVKRNEEIFQVNFIIFIFKFPSNSLKGREHTEQG
jgi:hypothetical protein